MYRIAIEKLLKWKQSKRRKPLIIEGARQVGKTWLMKEFGRQAYADTVYINFDSNSRMAELFASDLDTERLIMGLELYVGHKINPENSLLIFDEVQTGVGRTGELYAYMHYGVTPDLLTTAKALGGGFPVGALLATEECARVMTVGTHGTTYGGNPLASAVAGKVLELINTPEMLNGVKQRHDWFVERLNTINHRYGLFSEVRGLGLLIGCVLNADYAGQAKQISQEAAKAGVMVLIAGGNVVRFAPALNVSEEEVTTGLDRFAAACEHFVSRGSS